MSIPTTPDPSKFKPESQAEGSSRMAWVGSKVNRPKLTVIHQVEKPGSIFLEAILGWRILPASRAGKRYESHGNNPGVVQGQTASDRSMNYREYGGRHDTNGKAIQCAGYSTVFSRGHLAVIAGRQVPLVSFGRIICVHFAQHPSQFTLNAKNGMKAKNVTRQWESTSVVLTVRDLSR